MTSAFAKHSDILLQYELQDQLNWDPKETRTPASIAKEKKEEERNKEETIPDTEQQEGPEQNE
jgi:hypothetical protein